MLIFMVINIVYFAITSMRMNVNTKNNNASKPIITMQLTTSVPTTNPTPTAMPTVTKTAISRSLDVRETRSLFDYITSFKGSVTMYSLSYESCGKYPSHKEYGITSSGKRVIEGVTVAMGKNWKYGTKIRIEGFTNTYTNMDTGSGVGTYDVDIFTSNDKEATNFGRHTRTIYVISYGN